MQEVKECAAFVLLSALHGPACLAQHIALHSVTAALQGLRSWAGCALPAVSYDWTGSRLPSGPASTQRSR